MIAQVGFKRWRSCSISQRLKVRASRCGRWLQRHTITVQAKGWRSNKFIGLVRVRRQCVLCRELLSALPPGSFQ